MRAAVRGQDPGRSCSRGFSRGEVPLLLHISIYPPTLSEVLFFPFRQGCQLQDGVSLRLTGHSLQSSFGRAQPSDWALSSDADHSSVICLHSLRTVYILNEDLSRA